jgi:LPXTG-motif cell wall-anchored protein
MKQKLHLHRPAMAALFALVASSTAPVLAQEISLTPAPPVVVNAPPPVVSAPPPAVVTPAPAPLVVTPVARPAPPPAEAREAPARSRSVTRSSTTTRTVAPARSRPAPVRAAPVPGPVATAPTPPAAVAPAPAAPVVTPVQAAGPAAEQTSVAQYWPWLAAAGALLLAALVLLALRRRRTAYEEQEVYYDEPVRDEVAEPVHTAPVVAAVADEAQVSEPDSADMAALAAASEPVPDRPWLEFLMRPVRAGTRQDEAMVEFELTVGNTGSAPARDVRVSTWMVAAGEGSEMERSLIDPPADATRSELSIAPGDGALVEGAMALSKDGLHESVLPVVVADARYTLPDGSEGRTHASFAIGRPDGDELAPFPVDRANITENVEARLHGEPERV